MEVPECDGGKIFVVVVDAGKKLLAVVGWASFLLFRVFLVTFIVVVLRDAVTSQSVIMITFRTLLWANSLQSSGLSLKSTFVKLGNSSSNKAKWTSTNALNRNKSVV